MASNVERIAVGSRNSWLVMLLAVLLKGLASGQSSANASPASTQPHRLVIVSIPDRKLAVLDNGTVLRVFPVAVGASVSPSPIGEFEIVSHVADPTYSHKGVVIPAGADNPLGPRWMGLNKKGYGIHGTNAPRSIGKAASHGCIRLRNRDIVKLYPMLRVGDTVEIRAERDSQTAEIFGNEKSPATTVAQVNSAPVGAMGGGQ